MSGITTIETLLFNVRLSIRYHNRRRSFFDTVNLAASFIAVVFGSAAIAALWSKWPDGAVYAAALVSLVSGANLVLRSSERARQHHELARRFIELEQKVLPASEGEFFELYKQKLQIESDEPPGLGVLMIVCHNEQISAEGLAPSRLVWLRWWQRLFAPIIDLPPRPEAPPREGAPAA
jgi:hypothetical protein